MAYFVYEHWRSDTGRCFYVGKGSGRRSMNLTRSGHSKEHREIVEALWRAGLGVEIRMVADGLTNAEALALEQERIAFHGVENLTNVLVAKRSEALRTYARDRMRAIRAQERALNPPKERKPRRGYKHTPETIARMKVVAKARGISEKTREANRKALTGRKRKPFTPETIERMRAAALVREAAKRGA